MATVDFAKGVLTGEMLEICRIKDDEFDKTALLFSIYHRRSTDLRLVFHLDKIHKTGFARMKLKERVRQPKKFFQDFLTPKTVKGILTGFDKSKRVGYSISWASGVTTSPNPTSTCSLIRAFPR